jgi:hypothetical protein
MDYTSWMYALDFSWIVAGIVASCVFVCLLVHIKKGNQNSWLTKVTSMLLISSVSSILVGISLYAMNVQELSAVIWIIIMEIGFGFHFAFFDAAHQMLAYKFSRMAINVPRLLEGQEEIKNTKGSKFMFKLITTLNFIAPIMYGVFGGFTRDAILARHVNPMPFIQTAFAVSIVFVIACVINSGVVLIVSVQRIRTYFVEKKAVDYINTGMLVRHAAAYGCFVVACIAYLMA